MKEIEKLCLYAHVNDPFKIEVVKQEYREVFRHFKCEQGRTAVVGVGGAGADFVKRFVEDGLDQAVPVILIHKPGLHTNITPQEITSVDFNDEVRFKLLKMLKAWEIVNVVVVAGLSGDNGAVISSAAKCMKDEGYTVFAAEFYPFDFEFWKNRRVASENLVDLYCLGLDGVLLIKNEEVKEECTDDTLLSHVYDILDDPIREFVFRICDYTYWDLDTFDFDDTIAVYPSYTTVVDEAIDDMMYPDDEEEP